VSRFSTNELLADLEALVVRESPSDDASAVTALAGYIIERLRAAEVHAEARPCPPRGDAVLARIGEGVGGVLLLGHHDTVWARGTLAGSPFRVEDGRVYGPGVFDMKAGIAVAIAVLADLARRPEPPPVTLLLTPDEELGTEASRPLLLEVARAHRAVLVLEPSLAGAAKVARKGTGTFAVQFAGRAAHAGLDPEQGASALLELAHFTLFAAALTRPDAGTTVTPTVGQGGARTNVVPESARLGLDCRVWTKAEAERVEAALRAYEPRDRRVKVAIEGGFDRPPLEPTTAAQALYERAKAIATELGFVLPAARVGGASDGNLTAAAGVPTLDGLGPLGDGAHARHEWVMASDLPRRAELLVRLLSSRPPAGGPGPGSRS
jgi:glutamate carboxypeptidase